jgi:hypothetical protein
VSGDRQAGRTRAHRPSIDSTCCCAGERGQVHFLGASAADSHSLRRPYALAGHSSWPERQPSARSAGPGLADKRGGRTLHARAKE